MQIDVSKERRPCMVNLNKYWCNKLEIGTDGAMLSGYHHGFFQEIENAECAYPVAIVELPSGQVITIAADCLIFK